jgi:hypothetical protein
MATDRDPTVVTAGRDAVADTDAGADPDNPADPGHPTDPSAGGDVPPLPPLVVTAEEGLRCPTTLTAPIGPTR